MLYLTKSIAITAPRAISARRSKSWHSEIAHDTAIIGKSHRGINNRAAISTTVENVKLGKRQSFLTT